VRKVQADCAIEVDGNAYSVPWRLIGETVRVTLAGGQLRVSHAGREVAVHRLCTGRFERLIDPLHFEGVVGFRSPGAAAVSARFGRPRAQSGSGPGCPSAGRSILGGNRISLFGNTDE